MFLSNVSDVSTSVSGCTQQTDATRGQVKVSDESRSRSWCQTAEDLQYESAVMVEYLVHNTTTLTTPIHDRNTRQKYRNGTGTAHRSSVEYMKVHEVGTSFLLLIQFPSSTKQYFCLIKSFLIAAHDILLLHSDAGRGHIPPLPSSKRLAKRTSKLTERRKTRKQMFFSPANQNLPSAAAEEVK